MTMNRRGAMGTLIGAMTISASDSQVSSPTVRGVPPSDAQALCEAVRVAINTARSQDLVVQWGGPRLRVTGWNRSADVSRDGPAGINIVLGQLHQQLGTIAVPAAAGQFLLSPDGRCVRYFPRFERDGHVLDIEIMLVLTDDPTGATKLRELRICDPARFDPVATVTLDVQGDGRVDVTNRVQAAYDALVRRGGGTLQFPPGFFRLSLELGSRNVQLRGAGRLATQLLAPAPGAVVLRGTYRSGTWDTVTIADLSVSGGGHVGAIGFRAGSDGATKDDEFAGRTRFENVRFGDLDTCIDRPRGQIGLTIDKCQFEDARVHLSATARADAARALMHAGNILVRGTHFQRASDAVFRIDSPVTGSGQVTFEDCIMEANPGIVFDVRSLNAVDSVPAMLVSRCWNEQNATAAQVNVDGRPERPVYARLSDCSLIRFEDTPLGPLALRNSVVRTLDCSLDQLTTVTRDKASLLEHTRARMFSGQVPPGRVDSIEATYLNTAGHGVGFVLSHPRALSRGFRDALKISLLPDRPIEFSGTAAVTSVPVADTILPGLTTGQQLELAPNAQVFPSPIALTNDQWIAWLYVYRHVGGSIPTLSVTGSQGLTLEMPLEAAEWCTLGGMALVSGNAPAISFWHRCKGTPATIHIGGMNLLAFPTRQAARDFLNGGLFAI